MKTNYSELFESFAKKKVLIVGDVMIDSYIWGKVDRISPEAPVPILSVEKREDRLGGAANVALNVQSLGAEALLCSVIGEDSNAELFIDLLHQHKLKSIGIVRDASRKTSKKTRVIGHHQQLMRVDEEHTHPINSSIEAKLFEKIKEIASSENIDIIVFEDYDKGCISTQLIADVVAFSNEVAIPVVVDPKKRNFLSYKNVTLFKPNLKELKEGLKLEFDAYDHQALIAASKQLKDLLKANAIMITLSEQGVLIMDDVSTKIIPAHIRNIADVSGAGDTVISVTALALAAGLSIQKAAALANLAGGLVCEKVGVVPIEKAELLNEAEKLEKD